MVPHPVCWARSKGSFIAAGLVLASLSACDAASFDFEAPPDRAVEVGAVDRAVRNLPEGELEFALPQQWEEERTQTVRVRIYVDFRKPLRRLKESLKEELSRQGIETTTIPVSSVMSAHLSGVAFDVEPVTRETQAVSTGETTWTWHATPKAAGSQTLELVVAAVIDAGPLGRAAKSFPVYERRVQVEVNMPGRIRAFLAENSIALASLVIAVVALMFQIRKRRGRSNHS